MKLCTICKENPSGKGSYCRKCQRAYSKRHYHANKVRYYKHSVEKRRELQAYVWNLKAVGKCTDCGQNPHPSAMQYDHLPECTKIKSICKLVDNGSRRLLDEELVKCELVCANCHFIRTYNRSKEKIPFERGPDLTSILS